MRLPETLKGTFAEEIWDCLEPIETLVLEWGEVGLDKTLQRELIWLCRRAKWIARKHAERCSECSLKPLED